MSRHGGLDSGECYGRWDWRVKRLGNHQDWRAHAPSHITGSPYSKCVKAHRDREPEHRNV